MLHDLIKKKINIDFDFIININKCILSFKMYLLILNEQNLLEIMSIFHKKTNKFINIIRFD